jgi:uncharacterized membrane protein YjjB (DUF3815 family)
MANWRVLSLLLCLGLVSGASAQHALVSSSAPASVGLSLRGNVLTLDAQVAAATTLSVYCPMVPGLISFSGLTATVQASYDQKTRVLQLALPPGTYRIVIRSLP